jgi:hypothetical protein
MLNISYATVARAYGHYAALDNQTFYSDLGWSDRLGTPGFHRTGALNLSLALVTCGVHLNASTVIESGSLAGKRVDTRANHLADQLVQRHTPPELIDCEAGPLAAASELYGRRGIVAFMQRTGPNGGAIALLDGRSADRICAQAMHVQPYEIRFWPLY